MQRLVASERATDYEFIAAAQPASSVELEHPRNAHRITVDANYGDQLGGLVRSTWSVRLTRHGPGLGTDDAAHLGPRADLGDDAARILNGARRIACQLGNDLAAFCCDIQADARARIVA